MQHGVRLNGELIRGFLSREHRKITYLTSSLGCSESWLREMIKGQVPSPFLLKKLSTLIGEPLDRLLIEDETTGVA